jgi:hypothetical protein
MDLDQNGLRISHRRRLAVPRRYFSFLGKPLCAEPERCPLVRRDHAARRLGISGGMGLPGLDKILRRLGNAFIVNNSIDLVR